MAKAKKAAKEVLKWKKKKWVPIMAPELLRNVVIGESFVMDANSLVGKTVESNLMALTGDMKKQHTSVKFSIDSIKDGKAMTSFISYRLSPATIKRSVRRKKDRIDCVFETKSSDGKDVTVKAMLITRDNTAGSVRTSLRKTAIQSMKKTISEKAYDEIVRDVLDWRIQAELKRGLKTIYPLNICDIRYFGLKR